MISPEAEIETEFDFVSDFEQRYNELTRKYEHQLTIINAMGASTSDHICLFDRRHRLIYANPAVLLSWGKNLKEVLGKTIEEIGYPSDLADLHRAQLNETLNGKTVSGAYSRPGANGEQEYFEYVFTPVFDESSTVKTIVSTTQNSTYKRKIENERQRTLEQIQENESQFRNFADAIPHLAWIARADGYVTWYNERWYQYIGDKGHGYLGWGWQEICHSDFLTSFLNDIKQAHRTKKRFEMEIPLLGADGHYQWFLARGIPIFNTRGELIKWFGTHTNIDDQKRAADFNEKLQKFTSAVSRSNSFKEVSDFISQESRDLFGSVRNIIADVDDKKRLLKINAASGFTGDLLTEITRYMSLDLPFPMQECAKSGKPVYCESLEHLFSRWPATRSLDYRGTSKSFSYLPLIYDGKIRAVLASGYGEPRKFKEDERDFLEAIAQQCSQALERARIYDALQETIRSRDSFMGIASHELKTPLTSLKLQAQMIGKSFSERPENMDPPRTKKFINIVNEQVGRLSKLVDDMLDISRIETGKLVIHKERKDLCVVVRDVIDRFSTQFEMIGSQTSVNLCENAFCMIDSFRMEQVLNNLLTNAIKYAPGKPLLVQAVKDRDFVTLTIHDQGPGIAPEDHDKIFKRFERLVSNSEISGLGIGLFIAKQIVEAHDGKIWLNSLAGQGTSFFISLPSVK